MHAGRTADCPNCGGPIEFKLGSSAAAVCPYCRFSVVRRGPGLQSLGKLAELLPTAAIMAVGDAGEVEGRGFRVGGRLQLDHGAGPWDEWYVELDNGRWGWLAKAQGRFYLTHLIEDAAVPGWDEIAVGEPLSLAAAGDARFTVSEKGGSALLSAEGELPFPAVPQASGRYADLSGAGGLFATIDYGDGSEPPQLYVGREVPGDRVIVNQRALGPAPGERVAAERVRCPRCGGPIDIHTPETTERAACPSCCALLDYTQGNLAFVEQLAQQRREPLVPLGSEGVLRGESLTVVGYLERATGVDGERFAWREYLLSGQRGYRWLAEDNGHWVYLRPVPAGEVREVSGGARHRGTRFRFFQRSRAQVELVLGEFYWKVAAGDEAMLADHVSPPRILSSEQTEREVAWSLGEYLPGEELWKALELPGKPPRPYGIAPAQPNPVQLGWMLKSCAALLAVLFFLALGLEWGAGGEPSFSLPLKLPPPGTTSPAPEQTVVLSESFLIPRGPTTLRVELETNVSNAWVAVSSALVDEDTNAVREFVVQAEEWHGSSGGERWSEGSPKQTEYLGRVPAGRYVMRFDSRWGRERGSASGPVPRATVHVTAGKRSVFCCAGSGFLILLPLLVAFVRKAAFEAKRWRNSDVGGG